MNKSLTLGAALTAIALAMPARAFDGEATEATPTGPAATKLAEAQAAHTAADALVRTATENDTSAKSALGAAESAAKSAADGDAKTAAEAQLKSAKDSAAAAAKALKTATSDLAKAAKAVDKAQTAATKESEKLAAEQAKAAEKKAAEDKKAADKAAAEEAKKVNQQPEQNGIRRPKPDGMCGKAWTIFGSISQKNGSPASIGEALPVASAQGINDATTRTQYARWRKFYNISGRIDAPKPETPPAPPADVPPAPPAPPAE